MSPQPETLPVGRTLRLLLAVGLLVAAAPFFRDAGAKTALAAAGIVVALTAFYALVHRLVAARPPEGVDRCVASCLALLPLLLVFAFGGSAGRAGVLAFLGLSLLVAAARADPGCEVLSIPSLAFGRRSHLICLLFSPIDWIERKIAAAFRPPAAGP